MFNGASANPATTFIAQLMQTVIPVMSTSARAYALWKTNRTYATRLTSIWI